MFKLVVVLCAFLGALLLAGLYFPGGGYVVWQPGGFPITVASLIAAVVGYGAFKLKG